MLPREDLFLEDLCPTALVDTSDFQYLCSIDVGVRSSAHDRYAADHTFVYLSRLQATFPTRNASKLRTCTEE